MSQELCVAWNSYGLHFLQQREWEQAGEAFAIAVECDPGCAAAHYNLGIALEQQGQIDKAVASYRQAVQLNPHYAEAWHNLGTSLIQSDHYEDAQHAFRQAIQCHPHYAKAHRGLGCALLEMGRFEEACQSFQEAMRLGYADPDAGINLALSLLTLGRLPEAWPWYELRWQHWGAASLPQPLWDGSPLEGRTILLHAEQGLGDTIQFVRYAPLVKQRGGTVVVACPSSLVRIVQSCAGVDTAVPIHAELPAFDVQVPMMSLPRIFETTLATIPARVPYLFAEPARVEQWRKEFGNQTKLKVGIVWHASQQFKAGRLRSVPLAAFAPLARVPGVVLYSLQAGEGSEQLVHVDFPVTDLGSRSMPMDNLAAILLNLDLFVSADTAPAHLAGALGVPVWLALRHPADWRWFIDRSDSPWYPTATLFRQSQPGDWSSVFETMARSLQEMTNVHGRMTKE